MRVVITEFMDEAAVASLAARFDVSYDATLVDRPKELKALLAHADAVVVRNKTQVDAALLAAAPHLKVVGRLGVGLDNVDMLGCKARSIEVIPATGANALAVAEYVIGTAMVLLRGIYASTDTVAPPTGWPVRIDCTNTSWLPSSARLTSMPRSVITIMRVSVGD